MILKLTVGELKELRRYEGGPFGEDTFESFMAETNARVDEDTGELDFGRDEFERVATYKANGHQVVLDKVFKRAIDLMLERFFG